MTKIFHIIFTEIRLIFILSVVSGADSRLLKPVITLNLAHNQTMNFLEGTKWQLAAWSKILSLTDRPIILSFTDKRRMELTGCNRY